MSADDSQTNSVSCVSLRSDEFPFPVARAFSLGSDDLRNAGVAAMAGCCTGVLHLSEDNARVLLLAVFALFYMVAGALLFQYLESEAEMKMSRDFWTIYHGFKNYSGLVLSGELADENNTFEVYMDQVHRLMYAYGNASSAGVINKRRRWDFAGSFHFVGTIVSTIGYGSTAPQTTAGKACVILYGFFGCSIGILFFNLFLERIITLLAFVLRSVHVRRLRKRIHQQQQERGDSDKSDSRRPSRISRVPSEMDEDSSLDSWKPSVYWVMACLAVASAVVSSCAAAIYAPTENWTFFEALYFCFVSFATIGFGDLVSTQSEHYHHVYWYRLGNFCFLVTGCCCIYSLFNVTSIVIKQALNWLIYKLDYRCFRDSSREAGRILRRHSMTVQKRRRRRRSSAAMPNKLNRRQLAALFGKKDAGRRKRPNALSEVDSDSPVDSDSGRRNSGEMISMKDFLQANKRKKKFRRNDLLENFLQANKVSLAVMQKQLYETAQMTRGCSGRPGGFGTSIRDASSGSFTPGAVGPLAIVTQKLGDTDRR